MTLVEALVAVAIVNFVYVLAVVFMGRSTGEMIATRRGVLVALLWPVALGLGIWMKDQIWPSPPPPRPLTQAEWVARCERASQEGDIQYYACLRLKEEIAISRGEGSHERYRTYERALDHALDQAASEAVLPAYFRYFRSKRIGTREGCQREWDKIWRKTLDGDKWYENCVRYVESVNPGP